MVTAPPKARAPPELPFSTLSVIVRLPPSKLIARPVFPLRVQLAIVAFPFAEMAPPELIFSVQPVIDVFPYDLTAPPIPSIRASPEMETYPQRAGLRLKMRLAKSPLMEVVAL